MGLKIIYGKAGSGKSEYIFKEINKILNENNFEINPKIYVITPEQFSFTAEQKLMEGKKSIIGAEVITFNRLAYRVLNEIGGIIHTQVTKCGKAMLIYSILQSEKNKLTFLNKSDENIDLCMRIISELKKHGVTVEDLKKLKENKDLAKLLQNKINDIILIYEKFEEKINNKYIDETDLLTILSKNLGKTKILKNAIVYIDEFSGFTEQEYSCIKEMINIANQVTITMCVDNLNFNTEPSTDIFYPNKVTLKKIINLEKDKYEEVNLNDLHRFKNIELKYIEKYLYNTKIEKSNSTKNINLFLARNYYSEIENVAKNISRLIKERNLRYRDISIITKNIENYSTLTKTIFQKYEIPVFIDEKRELNQNIIVQYILSLIEVLNKNYSYEAFFNYLKMGFNDIEENDIFKLEKYCIKYGIKNNKLKNDFIYGIDENNKDEIYYLNELRKEIITPLIKLKNKIDEEKTAKNISKQIYLFLQEHNIEKCINMKINYLKKNNLFDLAKEYEESYKIIINVLDEINLFFSEEKVTLDQYAKILKIGLKNSGIGKIPGMQDQVIMGDTDRSRSRKSKVVFIIGLNDGIFPSINKNQGFLDDEDREILKNDGIEIAKGTLENLYDDNFNIYKAFTIAEEELFLSYASSDSEGKTLRASNLIFRIKKIFPELKEKSDLINNNNLEIINENILYEKLILELNKINSDKKINQEKIFYIIYKYYKQNKKYKINENIKYINYNFYENIKKENIDKLYGKKLNTSVSRLEKYKSCPFSYYLQYILKLKENEELKVQSLDTGSFMHEVIEEFFEETSNIKNITDEEVERTIDKIINEKLNSNRYFVFKATEKYKLLVTRLKRIIVKSMKYIIQTLTQSDFDLAGTEVAFSKTGKYKPILLNLADGKTVEITGKIDRIDIAKSDEKNYVRIIDYKSSVKSIDFGNIYAGLQLQLITYLDAVCKIEDLIPAGILYFNLLEQIINSNKKLNEEEIEKKIKSNFKMKGLILADVKVAQMQDNNLEKGWSDLIPAYIDSTGTLSPKRSSIASEEEFTKIQKYINKTIVEISNEILKGKIELKPFYKNKKTPCEYCGYKSMCGFHSGICKKEYKYIEKLNKDEFIKKIT